MNPLMRKKNSVSDLGLIINDYSLIKVKLPKNLRTLVIRQMYDKVTCLSLVSFYK